MEKREAVRQAIRIGVHCITIYFFSFIVRNLLSVATPYMVEAGSFSKEYAGLLSSTYMAVYALGQLVNGSLGDRIAPRFMLAGSLLVSGTGLVVFSFVKIPAIHFLCFGLMGFGLSMLTGPIYKTISENNTVRHAQLLCMLLSMFSFLGPLAASLLSMLLSWQWCFRLAGLLGLLGGAAVYCTIGRLERIGAVQFHPVRENVLRGATQLFRLPGFVFYMCIAALVNVVSISITFWTPTYITEHLGLSAQASSIAFSVLSLATVICPFVTMTLYSRLICRDSKLVLVMLSAAAVFFLCLRVVSSPILNLICLLMARMTAICAQSVVWNIYVPCLGRSGQSSVADGVLDFCGYVGASLANVLFSGVVGVIGWNGLIFLWSGLMVLGIVLAGAYVFHTRREPPTIDRIESKA